MNRRNRQIAGLVRSGMLLTCLVVMDASGQANTAGPPVPVKVSGSLSLSGDLYGQSGPVADRRSQTRTIRYVD